MEPHSVYCSPVWQPSTYEPNDNDEHDGVEYRQLDGVYSDDPVLNSTIWKHKDNTSSPGTEPLIEREDDNFEKSNESEEIIIQREEVTTTGSCSSGSACSSNSSSDNESVSNIPLPSESWTENRKRKVNSNVPKNTNPFLTDNFEEPASSGQKKMKTNEHSPEKKQPISSIIPKQILSSGILEWILQFQDWPHDDKLLALNGLIDDCDPTYVRHMMEIIEPQFQRDFISLLPKELALHVLSFLEPHDLLVAAQTCRYWRSLCDDNLLWREKCSESKIELKCPSPPPETNHHNHHHHHHHSHRLWNPQVSTAVPSVWKAAFLRYQRIQMNWRVNPIKRVKVLKGHDDHVITCLQFCGNRIVSGSDDNTLKVWSVTSGKCLRTLVGHTGGVWSSQMSGNLVISGSTDRTLKVWDLDSGECQHTLYGHTSTVRCMHLHGDIVVSGSRDTTLRVWEVLSGQCLHVLMGHLAAVRCVQYDGRLIVSGAYDYTVKVWDPENETCLHTLSGHTNRVYSLQFDGVHVVSGSLDTSIKVWDVETGVLKHTLMGHQSLTSGMELRNDILVSGNADSTVKVWNITNGRCLQTLSGSHKHQSAVTCLQFNSRFVITSSDDGTVKLWDVKTGEFIRNLVCLSSGGNGGVVWRIRASDTKLVCAVGSRNGTEETKLIVIDFDEQLEYV